ncbi:MAG TPA: aminotransferase [Rhodobacteraceae bacterium]|nr:aminotransferase [Paracoccaceae bacterium]
MNFGETIERRGTNSAKWDRMEQLYGVSPEDGLAMWVADMDFRVAEPIQRVLREMAEHGVFGYTAGEEAYKDAIRWWMAERHGWQVPREAIFTTTGLVNGVGMCLDAYTDPGDKIVLFTPVYHAFAKVIKGAGRQVVECEMRNDTNRYELDLEAWDAQLSGDEKMLILCSPHNPGGRVWTQEELSAIAAFCQRHDLLLVSDEIHHDLVFSGHRHIPMSLAAPEIGERLIMLTAASKTFNLAGLHTGNVIIEDEALRDRFARRMTALFLGPNSVGQAMTAAAYSPEGAAWVDALVAYLDGNRTLFDDALKGIPGLRSMPLESTYLAWVDFSGTGMDRAEFTRRVEQDARIAVNHGTTFGTGGEMFLRFNLGTQRARVEEAARRLASAFSDLQ